MIPNYTDLLGKPFAYHGRGPDNYDCGGLILELWQRAGIIPPIDCGSSENPLSQAMRIEQYAAEFCDKVETLQPLDIVTFQVVPRYVTHCGIYVGYGRFVHIMEKISVACEELSSPVWADKVRGFYRFRGVAQ